MPVKRSKTLAIVQRRRQVADLYLQGWSQAAIGEKLTVAQPTVCADLQAIRQQWRADTVRDFNEARAVELAKIDRVERESWAAWERSQQPVQAAVVTGDVGQQTASRLRPPAAMPRARRRATHSCRPNEPA